MGRGRQKAKQTKVARKLKYFSPDTDYRALERELTGPGTTQQQVVEDPDTEDFDDESWEAPPAADLDWGEANRR